MNRRILPCLAVLLAIPAAQPALAQITITRADLEAALLNMKRVNYGFTYFTPETIDLGVTSSSMQIFDFSGIPPADARDTTIFGFVEPAGQPGASEFPASNLCVPAVVQPFPGATVTFVDYLLLRDDGLYDLGSYSHQFFPPFIDTVVIERFVPMRLGIPLPLTYGTSRTGVDTTAVDSANDDYIVTTTRVVCDGWGTLTVPAAAAVAGLAGTVSVPSLRATVTEVEELYLAGAFATRTTGVIISFFTEDASLLTVDQSDTNYSGGDAQVDAMMLNAPTTATGVRQTSPALPAGYALGRNYPNPFNPSTAITFTIPSSSLVALTVHDALGRTVATLVERRLEPGSYEATFDASALPSGVYYYRLSAGAFIDTRSMMLVR